MTSEHGMATVGERKCGGGRKEWENDGAASGGSAVKKRARCQTAFT